MREVPQGINVGWLWPSLCLSCVCAVGTEERACGESCPLWGRHGLGDAFASRVDCHGGVDSRPAVVVPQWWVLGLIPAIPIRPYIQCRARRAAVVRRQ